MCPPTPVNSRILTDDVDFTDLGGPKLAKNTTVLYSTMAVQTDPNYWERAGEFWPDRWLEENVKQYGPKHVLAYLPFGGGKRKCIGDRLALKESLILMAQFFRKFRVEEVGG